jgi:hypothetical protein
LKRSRRHLTRELLVVLALLAAGTTGCSWLVGVSDDPVVVDGPTGADAGDADAD